MRPIVLVIDPSLVTPAYEAINCISKIMGELKESPQFAFSHFEYISLFLNKIRLKDFILNKQIKAVICLGSIANMTDNYFFVRDLIIDLEECVFNHNIPFFGICFSHQMLGNMFGFHVDFLKKRHAIPNRKHHVFRKLKILHPKFSLLATQFDAKDYYSNNAIDLDFKNAIKVTKDWNKIQWKTLHTQREWVLTQAEFRIKKHIVNKTALYLTSHARHEQEIWHCKKQEGEVVLAASSAACLFEALVHSSKPFFSIQTHPETTHQSHDGYLLIKNFIYMSSLIYDLSID